MYKDNIPLLLLQQYAEYPEMLIQDIVKFIYQNEFGSGHFVRSEEASLARLTEEYNALPKTEDHEMLFEDIGNGLCRMHLRCITNQLSLATVNRMFVHTANRTTGSISGLEEKLEVLRQLCLEGKLPYHPLELERYLAEYKRQGYPAVSHSASYHAAYRPAYRLVSCNFRDYYALFCRLDSLYESSTPVTLAIDGNSGSGKSTLSTLVAAVYDANVFHMDDFFLPNTLKTPSRLREPGGNVDYERFKHEVLEALGTGCEFFYRPFCCMRQDLVEPVLIKPKPLNIVEGVYSLHPALADSYNLRVCLTVEPALQSERILQRNGPGMHQRFLNEWIPLENSYFAELNIMAKCDLVFASVDDTYRLLPDGCSSRKYGSRVYSERGWGQCRCTHAFPAAKGGLPPGLE